MKDDPILDEQEPQETWYKNNDYDTIWWKTTDQIGVWLFSFDKKKVYNMFRDYPYHMTEEEVKIFDDENPEWADFFKDRK